VSLAANLGMRVIHNVRFVVQPVYK